MGRPKDKFWWDLAKKDGGNLQCTYCGKEFKGGVSRIKLHLSCRGGNIGPCKSVPKEIKEKAEEELQGGTYVGSTSAGEDGHGVNVDEIGKMMSSLAAMGISSHNQVSSSSSFNESPSNVIELVKFLMSRNVSVDVFKDSDFWSMLASVAHPVIQSWVQFLDNSAIIEKSLSNFEHEMNQYMKVVKESWKTTGCTLMLYDLSEGKGKFSADGRYNLVAGFYCPKGFIFVEVDLPIELNMCCYTSELDNALKNHHLNLSTDDVIKILHHSSWNIHEFQYREYGLNDLGRLPPCESGCHDKIVECFWHRFKDLWKGIYEGSDWLRNLIKKADLVYQKTLDLPQSYGKLKMTLKLNSVKQVVEGNCAAFLSRLRLIMDRRVELMRLLETDVHRALYWDSWGITAIIKDEEFWCDVKDVVEALTPLLQIGDLMDTLVPTAAYLQEALDKAGRVLNTFMIHRDHKPFDGILEGFQLWRDFYDTIGCLNPLLCMNEAQREEEGDQWEDLFINAETELQRLVKEEERERLETEFKAYSVKCSNPFANISRSEGKVNHHPVKLWEKYGSDFPMLRKYATKILSQPVTCLCKQVEKCMSQLCGSDSYILRLNAMMKEEFDKLGDEIYQPIDVDSIFKDYMEQIAA